jgi:putative two-component system response regulator
MEKFNEDKAVAQLAEIMALECGIPPDTAKIIKNAAFLHDIGKRKIPASILSKPGKLDKWEFEIVKNHTKLGAIMLRNIQGDLGRISRDIALYHHERHDGKGYWHKFTDKLPIYVPITILTDVFIALVSERQYKHAWPPNEAISYIQDNAGTQFSPELARVFLSLLGHDCRIPAIIFDGIRG